MCMYIYIHIDTYMYAHVFIHKYSTCKNADIHIHTHICMRIYIEYHILPVDSSKMAAAGPQFFPAACGKVLCPLPLELSDLPAAGYAVEDGGIRNPTWRFMGLSNYP